MGVDQLIDTLHLFIYLDVLLSKLFSQNTLSTRNIRELLNLAAVHLQSGCLLDRGFIEVVDFARQLAQLYFVFMQFFRERLDNFAHTVSHSGFDLK
jgi:hypothetical protein